MGDEVDLTACLDALSMGGFCLRGKEKAEQSVTRGEKLEIWWFSPTTRAAADAEQ